MSTDYLIGYELAQVAVDRVAEGNRDKVWGSMVYACSGRQKGDGFDLPPCGHEERYYLGVGVEGPKSLRARTDEVAARLRLPGPGGGEGIGGEEFWQKLRDELIWTGATIPSPAWAGSCPQCYGGQMMHVRWKEDEDFGEELRDPPEGARYFRVPDAARARYSARFENYGGAELVCA